MRRYGVPERYEKPKELTRGGAVNEESIRDYDYGNMVTALLQVYRLYFVIVIARFQNFRFGGRVKLKIHGYK
ncbi:hypothetical protein YC2023_018956 [Brassica napus]